MKSGWKASLVCGIVSMLLIAVPSWAGHLPSFKDILDPDSNERGFTISGLLTLNVTGNPLLSPETMSRVSDDVHRPPQRGLQLEFLCPGDFGATVRFRW
jgi:hypothetical protein